MRATCERSFFRTAVKECHDEVKKYFTLDGVLTIPPPGSALPCGSGPNTVHYSFDFAQQVHYPHNPLKQPESVLCLECTVRAFPAKSIT